MSEVEIRIVEYGSELQKKSVELRYRVLREPLGLVYTPEQLNAEKDEVHIVALNANIVVGVLLLKNVGNRILKMRQVAVESGLQGSGIGSQLVHFAENYAAQHGYTSIELHARQAAKDFYLKLAYGIEGEMFEEVGIPHYKMVKLLQV